jgi:large subunit ribosomal protein L22
MTGPKLNEANRVAGSSSGAKCVVRHVRTSASKARLVLDLIRGLDIRSADEVLQFLERDIAHVIRKALASAVANAVNNDGQDVEELCVSACFADEGPTLKRFRPRARGRAGGILKRTCHITVIVNVMAAQELAVKQARDEKAATSGAGRRGVAAQAASRRDRVARSRKKADGVSDNDTHDHDTHDNDTHDHDHDGHDHEGHDHDHDHGDADTAGSTAQAVAAEVGAGVIAAPFGDGSAAPLEDGSAPEGFTIKGNAQSMLYHVEGTRYYKATKAEVWFASEEAAESAGFSKPGSTSDDASDDATDGEDA